MSFKEFDQGVRDLMARHYEVPALCDDTELSAMDSLGVTEVCQLGDDQLGIELNYKDVRSCEKYKDLKELCRSKGVEVDD